MHQNKRVRSRCLWCKQPPVVGRSLCAKCADKKKAAYERSKRRKAELEVAGARFSTLVSSACEAWSRYPQSGVEVRSRDLLKPKWFKHVSSIQVTYPKTPEAKEFQVILDGETYPARSDPETGILHFSMEHPNTRLQCDVKKCSEWQIARHESTKSIWVSNVSIFRIVFLHGIHPDSSFAVEYVNEEFTASETIVHPALQFVFEMPLHGYIQSIEFPQQYVVRLIENGYEILKSADDTGVLCMRDLTLCRGGQPESWRPTHLQPWQAQSSFHFRDTKRQMYFIISLRNGDKCPYPPQVLRTRVQWFCGYIRDSKTRRCLQLEWSPYTKLGEPHAEEDPATCRLQENVPECGETSSDQDEEKEEEHGESSDSSASSETETD